jgi:hypothetical protein
MLITTIIMYTNLNVCIPSKHYIIWINKNKNKNNTKIAFLELKKEHFWNLKNIINSSLWTYKLFVCINLNIRHLFITNDRFLFN